MTDKIFVLLLFCGFACSCSTSKKTIYFQDVQVGKVQPVAMSSESNIRVQTGDMLSIIVSSKDPELAVMFNLPRTQQTISYSDAAGNNPNGQVVGYTVDSEGNIDFPVLGALHIKGLTREETAKLIKGNLATGGLLKDAVVTIDFLNLSFSVLGEVARPGQFRIVKDRVTLPEALSMAGDLTIHGKRDGVFLTRQTGKERITYQVDLRTSGVYDSPAFFVQQNDLIYIEPNAVRANQSTVNGNNVRSVSLWMSVASFLTTIGVLIFK